MYLGNGGIACPIGFSVDAACAALRAGIAKFDDLPFRDNRWEPIVGAAVPDLEPGLKRGERLLELLAKAVANYLESERSLSVTKVPLLLGLAEPGRPGGGAHLANSILPALEKKLSVRFHDKLSRTFPKGHTAGLEALRAARQLLESADVPGCLVGGVDSFINAGSLEWLDRHERLKKRENSNGVIPGEAAAVIWVQRRDLPGGEGGVKVTGLGFGHEKAGVLTEEPLLGLGLAEAERAALAEAGRGMHEIDVRYSDVTGESYGFREQALAIARVMRVRRPELALWHCADAIGDTGAAAGICLLLFARQALRKGYAPGGRAICCCSAVPGERAVAVLERKNG
jgi:3-oxoacyl-[acyl-carrier-protein] synthase I